MGASRLTLDVVGVGKSFKLLEIQHADSLRPRNQRSKAALTSSDSISHVRFVLPTSGRGTAKRSWYLQLQKYGLVPILRQNLVYNLLADGPARWEAIGMTRIGHRKKCSPLKGLFRISQVIRARLLTGGCHDAHRAPKGGDPSKGLDTVD